MSLTAGGAARNRATWSTCARALPAISKCCVDRAIVPTASRRRAGHDATRGLVTVRAAPLDGPAFRTAASAGSAPARRQRVEDAEHHRVVRAQPRRPPPGRPLGL